MKDVRLIPYLKKFEHSYSMGVFPTIELMSHRPERVIKVIFHPKGKQNKGVQKLISLCANRQIKTEWNDGLIKKLGGNDNTYAVGVFEKYQEAIEANKNHLVLVNPEDSGNLGTMLRTALAFGIENVAIIRPAIDMFDPKTIRASMGSVFLTKIEYFDDFEAYADKYKNKNYLLMTDGSKALSEITFEKPYSLVFGGESSGLSVSYKNFGATVRIPQSEKVDSLNLAIAAGITMYSASQKG